MDDAGYSISEVAAAFGLAVSALRYYEEVGLLAPTSRRGRVRYYDRSALRDLAYLQLWRDDGMLSIAETKAVIASETAATRREIVTGARDRLTARIAELTRARAVLDHMLDCPRDRPSECEMTGTHIGERVAAALNRTVVDDGFLPAR
ncbi:MerR family transcriptional regulator [Gordonia soli]|uniref:Putative MerR family transcriptional regulator n=1 Tax=Gordonia soli NBRC 108243 TaxID=1223545 RepID=M0QD98_9ACTN|nr:MerR family transcriptional regulator [Gordonia soli]GAC66550.1 putative MerR family transcriptional regulator [Gordonia soli NBRC 108243]